jgi:hypothetical protein
VRDEIEKRGTLASALKTLSVLTVINVGISSGQEYKNACYQIDHEHGCYDLQNI